MKNYTKQPRRSLWKQAWDPRLLIWGLPPNTSGSGNLKLTCVLGRDRGPVLAPWTRWLPSSAISPSLSLPGPPSLFLLPGRPPHPPAPRPQSAKTPPSPGCLGSGSLGWRRRAARVRASEQRRPGSRRCSAEDERAPLASGARRKMIRALWRKAVLAPAPTGNIPAAKWCNEKVSWLNWQDESNNPTGGKTRVTRWPRPPASVWGACSVLGGWYCWAAFLLPPPPPSSLHSLPDANPSVPLKRQAAFFSPSTSPPSPSATANRAGGV